MLPRSQIGEGEVPDAELVARAGSGIGAEFEESVVPLLHLERLDQVGFASDVDLIDTAERFMLTGWRLRPQPGGKTRLTLQVEQL